MKYYKITVRRGHVGYANATITFYEKAKNMLEACDKARKHGGVKHNRLPTEAVEITADEFYANNTSNAYERAGCKGKIMPLT